MNNLTILLFKRGDILLVPNKEQAEIIKAAVHWYYHESEQVFQFAGKAGRGKTFVLHKIIQALGIPLERIAPMSYIGCASLVMRTKGLTNAKTIHSWLFNPVEDFKYDKNGNIVKDNYLNRPIMELHFEPKPLDNIDLIIIDEGGTCPKYLKSEIESRGIKIIVCGDLSQLPPVGDDPAYLISGKIHMLIEPMRQAKDSAILWLAERALDGYPIHPGYYGDCLVIYEDELTDEMIKMSDIIICGKNYTRDLINKNVRHNILNKKGELPTFGEKLICKKNNWKCEVDGINLTNGLVGIVINSPSIDGFDGKSFTIDFKPDILNTYFSKLKCDYNYLIAPHDKRQYLKNDKYSPGNKFEFAYAITTHSSQGSQFYNGIYIREYLSRDIQKNLDYTAITRFSNAMIYVIKRKKYY